MINNPLQYLKDKAEAFGMYAVIADVRSTTYELQQLDITDGKFVAILTRNGSIQLPKEGQSFNGDATHAVEMVIYRKFENDTMSSIAETYGQKYANRLQDSVEQALQFLLSLNCSNEFDVTVNSIDEVINQTTASMDGVKISLSLRAWNQY
jgi:hypothetical protein